MAVSARPEGGYGGQGTGGPGSGGPVSGGLGSGGLGSGGLGSGGQGTSGLGVGGPGIQARYVPATSRGQGGQYGAAPASYNFQWDVNDQPSGNFYGHGEQRDGDNTQGSYYVQLPDSRQLKVEYFVDQFGYHPTVTFEGDAQYPSGSGQGTGSQKGYYQ
ncbi:pro-resilin-like [Procambarus clarkii]|uniref:pro-resilin-like n=1 Tax=Procambarus clarkii TaxID=6728 RepID=UPI00374263C1